MAKGSMGRPGVSAAEWAVMKVLWESGPMAVGDIYAQLSPDQDWAYSTVKTLVRRLVAKGWIDYQRVGGSFLYKAAVPQKRAIRSAIKEFSERVLNGLLSPFVAYYAEEEGLSAEDIARIEEIIATHRRKGGGRK